MANNNRFPRQYTVLSPEGLTISVYQPEGFSLKADKLEMSNPRVIKCVLTRKSVVICFINSDIKPGKDRHSCQNDLL